MKLKGGMRFHKKDGLTGLYTATDLDIPHCVYNRGNVRMNKNILHHPKWQVCSITFKRKRSVKNHHALETTGSKSILSLAQPSKGPHYCVHRAQIQHEKATLIQVWIPDSLADNCNEKQPARKGAGNNITAANRPIKQV